MFQKLFNKQYSNFFEIVSNNFGFGLLKMLQTSFLKDEIQKKEANWKRIQNENKNLKINLNLKKSYLIIVDYYLLNLKYLFVMLMNRVFKRETIILKNS